MYVFPIHKIWFNKKNWFFRRHVSQKDFFLRIDINIAKRLKCLIFIDMQPKKVYR